MNNGLRQGSVLSPKLFCFYSDKLNKNLNESKIGCHVRGIPMNNFAYADDLVLLCPSASALNDLLDICFLFAKGNYIIFSIIKTECMCICPTSVKLSTLPDIIIGGNIIKYVEFFKYLGHILNVKFKDDDDILKEMRNLYARGNTIVRLFKNTDDEVKIRIFKCFCYPVYCSSMWSRYNVYTMNKLRVGYNNIFRKLFKIKLWDEEQGQLDSLSRIYEEMGIRSFYELFRYNAVNCQNRISLSENPLVQCLLNSDAMTCSRQWSHWDRILAP